MNRIKKPRILIAESIIESLARDLASYRLDG